MVLVGCVSDMIVKGILFVCVFGAVAAQVLYDAFYGKPVNERRRGELDVINATSVCTVEVRACRHEEGRRVDGSCANPKFPPRGAVPTPLLRLLPAKFGLGNQIRPAHNGSMLPSARLLRTKLLSDGLVEDRTWTAAASNLFVFSAADNVDLLVLLSYVGVSDCCIGNTPNQVNPRCIPIPVPGDDPFLRRTGVRCMNLTRLPTFQDLGCAPNTLPAERYSTVPPLLDLSIIYGNNEDRARQVRTFQGGELKTMRRDGVERPPGTGALCFGNRRPRENSCYEYGDNFDGNTLQGIYLTAMWFYREHNRLARKLAVINPCWDDEKLYTVAREINIAQYQYILYYELFAKILGWKNAVASGVIYETDGYVNDFDSKYKPGVYHEYVVGARYFHNFQDGRADLYNKKGEYLGSRQHVDDELRPGILELNNTEADLTQGCFRQPAAKFDHTLDPELSQRLFGEFQTASDMGAIDIMRGRDQGLAPYIHYREFCGLPHAHNFDDFKDVIDPDKVEQMRRIYDDELEDVDLMAAVYSERLLAGADVGPTLYCILVHNLLQWRRADRHFFEHGDIPTALSLPQLKEIRSTSVARLVCDNGDQVDAIQPRALHHISKQNKITSCKHIPGADLTKWYDPTCNKYDKGHRTVPYERLDGYSKK